MGAEPSGAESSGAGPRRILIAGCGDLGTRAGLEWAKRGAQVWGLRRSEGDPESPLRWVQADLTEAGSLESLPFRQISGLDTLLYSAAASGFNDEAYRAAYVDGLAHLLSALERHQCLPHRLIYVSSTSVYAQTDGSIVDETSPTEPEGFGGRRLLEGEAVALGARVPKRSVVRLGGIYGPGRTRLLDSVRRGEAVCFDDPPIWTNRIHIRDCAGIVTHLAELREPEAIYLGVDDEPSVDGVVKRWLAQKLGVPAPPRAEQPPSSTSRRMRSNKRCSNARLRASGFVPRYPTFREGYGELIEASGVDP